MALQGKIAFVGSGIMAEAMIQGLLKKKLIPANKIACSDPRPERLKELERAYPGIKTSLKNATVVEGADVVVLAIKPQMMKDVLADLHNIISKKQLVLSIVAGSTLESISRGLNHERIVRAMPNTPARIGQGITAWTKTSKTTSSDLETVKAVLNALGTEIFLEREEEIDMATALSGTGPSYIFLIMEALVDAGVHLGFPRRVATQLVLQTVKGSVEFALQSQAHLAELRNQVTSPGGTSAEAIYQMEKGGVRTVISKSVWWAFKKSLSLSKLTL